MENKIKKADIVISLGGSLIFPENIDINFLKKFRQIILDFAEEGNNAGIICGGGRICRNYQDAAKEITKASEEDLDWLGIKATKLNAELVRAIFGNLAYEKVIDDPKETIETDKRIIIGAGHLPGSSSDLDAVLLAINIGAKTIINLTNIDYVYDKDPREHKDAKPLRNLTWTEFIKIIGSDWKPGKNVPFDPVAAREAQIHNIEVIILNGRNLENFAKCLYNRGFIGTRIE